MPTEQPNILIVMVDQMTAALTGVYGHPVVKTPALDSLAAEGVRFDAAYSNSPICVPARAAMLSGRYISRTRTYDNGAALPCDVPTFAHHLRVAGYETAVSGKMHLIGADQLHGFERRLTTDIYPSTFKWTPDWCGYDDEGIANEKETLTKTAKIGVRDWTKQLDYDSEVQFRALEFLRSRRTETEAQPGQPFCLMVSYTHPHPPYQITQEYWDMYEGAEIDLPDPAGPDRETQSQMDRWLCEYQGIPTDALEDRDRMYTLRRTYYGMVSYVDAQIGQLLETLEQCGLRDNTAIIFLADHGDMLGERGMVEKRAFYEWSARVPFIASFPGHWAQGITCDDPVSLVDLFPTLAEFTDAPVPIDIDGQSFADLLEDPSAKQPDRVAVGEYHCEGVAAPCFMARKGPHKYIYIHGHEPQLFDLENDPEEVRNVAGQAEYEGIERALRNEILSRFDPDAIAEDVRRSQAERLLMQQAMDTGERTTWDYQPFYDAKRQYRR
jgi:choline-sulfatase